MKFYFKSSLLLLFLISIFLHSCDKKAEQLDRDDFFNKTFDYQIKSEDYTLTAIFKDSVYFIHDNWIEKSSWEIKKLNDNRYLTFDYHTNVINRLEDGQIEFTSVEQADRKILLTEKEKKFSKQSFIGKWMEKKSWEMHVRDSIPVPTPPPPSNGLLSEEDYIDPSFYEIQSDSIYLTIGYSKFVSHFDLNNTGEFAIMKLGNSDFYHGEEICWKVNSVTDSTLSIQKIIHLFGEKGDEQKVENIKLLKLN